MIADDLLTRVDAEARRLGISRADVVRIALTRGQEVRHESPRPVVESVPVAAAG